MSKMTIRHGDVWTGSIQANIVGYSPKVDMFDLHTGAKIARTALLRNFHREHRGTGKVLWEGPGAEPLGPRSY